MSIYSRSHNELTATYVKLQFPQMTVTSSGYGAKPTNTELSVFMSNKSWQCSSSTGTGSQVSQSSATRDVMRQTPRQTEVSAVKMVVVRFDAVCQLSPRAHTHMGVPSWVDSLGLGGLTAAWLYAALSGLIPGLADNGGGFSGRERIAADPQNRAPSLGNSTDQPKYDYIRWAQDTACIWQTQRVNTCTHQ